MEVVNLLADDLVASGVGALWASSGVSVQVNYRRDTGADTYVVLRQTGGSTFPGPATRREQQTFQALVDSNTLSGVQAVARQVYDQLHSRENMTLSGVRVMQVLAIAPPNVFPTGPGANDPGRFQASVNLDAFVVR
jgi:hypothetical protein